MIYLSGKITGKDREDYLSEFDFYEKMYQKVGYVVNPAKTCDTLPVLEQGQYMDICFTLLRLCDVIVMLPNWENSEGAKKELAYAIQHKIDVEVAQIF